MNRAFLRTVLRAGALLCTASLSSTVAFAQSTEVAQSPKSIISLDSSEAQSAATAAPVKGEASFANPPANFYSFASARVGGSTYVEHLTLRFAASTKLTKIESTKDFQIEQGGSCAAESFFSAGDTCTLLVRFTPQGPGARLGKVTVSHTASVEPFAFGIGGFGYAPIVSFTPAVISTIPSTYPSSTGLLSNAKNLTVDGGDTLYIADTGNNVIREIDSSGAIKNLTATATGPLGIAVDAFGEVYFDEPSANTMHEIYGYGPVVQVNGTGTANCPASTPCNLTSEALGTPGMMSMDPYNHLFFVDSHEGAAMATVQPLPAKLIFLYDPFPYQTNPSSAFAADASDNLYSLWSNGGECEIVQSSLFNAENSNVIFTKIAGGHTCGFSGDGGLAGNAEMGATIGQMAFDSAGNLYFSDTVNQRVRRIDYTTGIIHTIAGTGTAGFTGDGGPATSAHLNEPTGVAVDSQGQVYIISGTHSSATEQLVRVVGTNGDLVFSGQLKGTASAAKLVTVSNAGNSALEIDSTVITGTNKGDFSIDPNTTSCLLTTGSTLNAGQSCQIGIIFKPAASGTRSASLTMLDNTVNNSNTVLLSGTGTLPAPTFKITAPAAGSSVTSGTTVKFSVTVTSSSGTAPTGTVKFSVDGAAFGSPVTVASGAASVNLTGLTVKTHTISAAYSGDSNYASATASESLTVKAAAATKSAVQLSSKTNPAVSTEPISFSAMVETKTGREPQGTVKLLEGKTILAKASLKDGIADFTVTKLSAGTHMVIAEYSGDGEQAPASSTLLRQVVR